MSGTGEGICLVRVVSTISLLMSLVGALMGCTDQPRNTSAQQSPGTAVNASIGAGVNDAAFRAAAGCSDCKVIARSTVTLSLTGKTFVDAKLMSARGLPMVASVDLSGKSVDSRNLVAAEEAVRMARQGNLRDVLYPRSLTSSSDPVPVSIWADFRDGHEPRERMMSDTSFRAVYQSQTASRLHAASSKVTAWLDARGFATHDRGIETPLITADVPASALTELGRLGGVAVVDLRYPEVPNSLTWFDTVKGPAAQMMVGSAAGVPFCNGEGTQPYDPSYLSVTEILDSSSLTSHHMQWTSELISATASPSMAPGAAFYVPAYDHGINGSNQYTFYQAWSWCFTTLGVNNMNRSASLGQQGQVPLTPDDMAEDYYAYHYPYPFITLSAGNCVDGYQNGVNCFTGSPVDGGYVENHAHNALVVGASDTNATPQTSDDAMAYFSPYGNPATPHHDFELPNLVAPGSDEDNDITSASGDHEAGTSASAPIVMGTALLMKAKDSTLTAWPELVRAIILSASTHPVDGGRTEALYEFSDIRQGAGLLNAAVALQLADGHLNTAPNNTPMPRGREGQTYYFDTDFANGISAPYNIVADMTGDLRVVIAWDSTTQGCNADGSGCADNADVIDADLDLRVSHYIDGSWQDVCDSTTWDGSWELCDVHAVAGDLYKAEIIKYATNSTQTYLGISWNTYDPSAE